MFFFQLLTPHIIPMCLIAFALVRRFWDRKMSMDMNITRKELQSNFEKLYIGPEFLLNTRLSQIITLIWTTFFFMPAIPTLSLVMVMVLVMIYWVDKFLLLRFYRTPKGYHEEIIQFCLKQLKWTLVFHGIMGVFMLSNEKLLSD